MEAGPVWTHYLYDEQERLSAVGGGLRADGSLNSNRVSLAVRNVAACTSRSCGGWLQRSSRSPEERRRLRTAGHTCKPRA